MQLSSPPATPSPSDKPLKKRSKISVIETRPMPSSLPHFQPTSPEEFGLIQEKLRHEPWKMLVAVIFLNVTTAKMALPLLGQLFERWPTPEALSQGLSFTFSQLIDSKF
jgi:methyl-CpG-binding domain protein 4